MLKLNKNQAVNTDVLGFKEELGRIWVLLEPLDKEKEDNYSTNDKDAEDQIDSLDLFTEFELRGGHRGGGRQAFCLPPLKQN